jgi:hypothetical protein
VNDPFSSFLSNVGGVFTGTNPPFAPSVADLVGFNIPGKPLISARDYFLAQMTSWLTTIPMTTQWIVVIERFPTALNSSFIQGLERVDASRQGFDITTAVNLLKSFPYQRVIGCLFTHGVTIPSEQYDVGSVSVPNNRGFLPGIIAGGRNTDPPTLVLEFRETNTSFVDSVIRPWSILTSHYGLTVRPGDQYSVLGNQYDDKNMKTNMVIMQFTRSIQNISMIPRKAWYFYNCAPYNISEQSLEYSEEKLQILTTRWTYTNYTIADSLYLPVGSIIDTVAQGGLNTIITDSGLTTGPFNPFGG